MATMAATVNGYRQRALKTWYPTSGSWTADGSNTGVTNSISAPTTTETGTTSSGNKYGTMIKVTTPSSTSIGTISALSITFDVYDRNTTAGTLYGSLRTTYTDSSSSDTVSFFRTNAIGSEASATSISSSSTSPSSITFTFSGSFSQGTSYYLFLYTKSTNDIYGQNDDKNMSASITYTTKSYTISYNANGHGTAPSSQTKTHGVSLTLRGAISNVAGTGYTVSYDSNGSSSSAPSSHTNTLTWVQLNWNTNSSGTGTTYAVSGSYTANASATLYAQWSYTLGWLTVKDAITRSTSSSSYTIKYNANGGSSTPSNQTLTRSTPYTFKEWNTNSSGTGVSYDPGDSIQPTAATTLYAIWTTGTTTGSITLASAISKASTTETGYTVTLEANGGTVDSTTLTTTNTRSYTFNKWNTASDGSGTSYSAGAAYSTAASKTLYATFNSSISAVSSVSLPTPKKSGYIFLGWSTTNGSTTYVDQNYTPSGNTTLYANYREGYAIEMYLYNGGRWMNVLMS